MTTKLTSIAKASPLGKINWAFFCGLQTIMQIATVPDWTGKKSEHILMADNDNNTSEFLHCKCKGASENYSHKLILLPYLYKKTCITAA